MAKEAPKRIQELREEHGLLEALRIYRSERLKEEILAAQTIEDLKPILLRMIEG